MLAVQPTMELAKRNSRQRIDPLIDESPELRERVKPARSRNAGNTMLSKEFAGGILIMTDANSAVGLRSTPARYIFLDEVDAYPASVDEKRRSGLARRGAVADLRSPPQGVLGLDPDDPGPKPDRTGVRGLRPAALLRRLPALRGIAVAEVRAAAVGEGQARVADDTALVEAMHTITDDFEAYGWETRAPASKHGGLTTTKIDLTQRSVA